MHLGLCLSVVFMTYVILTDSLAPSSNLSFSQNLFDNADTSAEASLVSMPSSPEPSGSARLTAGPEPKDYTVIPLVPTKVTAVSEFIQTFAVKDSVKTIIDQYRREYNNVLYWSFKATKTAAKALEENLGHDATLFEDKTAYEQADLQLPQLPDDFNGTNEPLAVNAYTRQCDAKDDLRVVSWPPGKNFANVRGYLYGLDWRRKPTIYIIDTGLDTTSSDFRLGIDDWLYSPKVKASRKNTPTDDDPNSHGSCVLSKALGAANGVYKNSIGVRQKNSKVVVVKIDPHLDVGEVLSGFSAVRTDIANNRGVNPAVVVFAINSGPNYIEIQHAATKSVIQQIFNLGGVVVVSSGNKALTQGRQDVDSVPASWEANDFPLIVVGATNNAGAVAPFSQGPTHVTVWAPGNPVQCARRYGFYNVDGTSASAGMVAGLMAYGLALEKVAFTRSINTPTFAKNWLTGMACWPRQNGGRPVIWNQEQG